MKQTGDGHFSPIAGVHLGRQLGLVLDTARFKYPSYWCDLSTLYNSMQLKDSLTKKARGFVLLSRNIREMRSNPKSQVGPDLVSIRRLREDLKHGYLHRVKEKLSQIETQNATEKELQLVYCLLTCLPKEVEYLLAYYLFEFSVRVNISDANGAHADELIGSNFYNKLQGEIESSQIYFFVKNLLENRFGDLSKHTLFVLICDFVPELFQHVATLILASMPKELLQKFEAPMINKLLEDLQGKANTTVNKEILSIKQILGF